VVQARKEKQAWVTSATAQVAREILQIEITTATEVLQTAKVLLQLLQDGKPLTLIVKEN
jgi:hypothetical protein